MDDLTADQMSYFNNVKALRDHLKLYYRNDPLVLSQITEVMCVRSPRFGGKSMLDIVWSEGEDGLRALISVYEVPALHG